LVERGEIEKTILNEIDDECSDLEQGDMEEDCGEEKYEEKIDLDVWKKGDEVRALTKIETDTLRLMREVFEGNAVVEIPSLKTQDGRKIGEEVKLVDGLMHNLIRPKMTVTEVNRKVVKDRLERKYKLMEKGTIAVSTLLKNKITSASTKIRQYVGKSIARRQNNLFKNNQARLYKELSGNSRKTEAAIPNADEAQGFWKGIWSEKKEHDKEASWLGGIREELNKVERQEDIVLRLEDVSPWTRLGQRLLVQKIPVPP